VDFAIGDEAYTGPGTLANSRFLDGLDVESAKRRAIAELEKLDRGMVRPSIGYAIGGEPSALLGLPHSDNPLSRLRNRAGSQGSTSG